MPYHSGEGQDELSRLTAPARRSEWELRQPKHIVIRLTSCDRHPLREIHFWTVMTAAAPFSHSIKPSSASAKETSVLKDMPGHPLLDGVHDDPSSSETNISPARFLLLPGWTL